MQKIKQLPLHEAQKIAAGEVVERPANAIKELIENSIDAQAQQVQIYIENGGQSLIRVVDNGYGMSSKDAQICFDHHATSKINTVEDLLTLQSFGFRGEALASIAAVSTICLITKEKNTLFGTQVNRDAQTIVDIKEVSCAEGTDITIKNLFYNVPARKKFLKTVPTEVRQITQLFQAFCFDYPTIHFSLYSENKLVYNCPPVKTLLERVFQFWDRQEAEHMISLDSAENKEINISGIISNHQSFRYDRYHQFFFVNQRWIKNHQLAKALLKGYLNVIPQNRYPAAVISIQINSAEVDINIHPRKQEVQFLHPRIIEQLIQKTVKQTLENHLSQHIQKPVTFSSTQENEHNYSVDQPFKPATLRNNEFIPSFSSSAIEFESLSIPEPITYSGQDKEIKPAHKTDENLTITVEKPSPLSMQNIQLLGQLKKTYILAQDKDGLFIIDQHAAHERILYEQFRTRFNALETINLITPHIVSLSEDEYQTIHPHLEHIGEYGLALEPFGNKQLIIQSTLGYLKKVSFETLIKEIISLIKEYAQLPHEEFHKMLHEKIHAQMACKAAVKAGDTLSNEQMQQLLNDLYETKNRFACPHGRPTGWLLTTYEIEKKFKRKL
ncbi:MAG: DNA mismatch repair endonuclease MutL [Candidatus Babeliales bacterium]